MTEVVHHQMSRLYDMVMRTILVKRYPEPRNVQVGQSRPRKGSLAGPCGDLTLLTECSWRERGSFLPEWDSIVGTGAF